MSEFKIRQAETADTVTLLEFIKRLAEYEKLSSEVTADAETLRESLFGERKYAEALLGFEDDTAVVFAIYFHNFSTFLGRPGIYLEDVFVLPEKRGLGYGKAVLKYLANLALERNCGRLEWSVLDWNKPAIKFYKSLGAAPMDEWTVFRITGGSLENLAKE